MSLFSLPPLPPFLPSSPLPSIHNILQIQLPYRYPIIYRSQYHAYHLLGLVSRPTGCDTKAKQSKAADDGIPVSLYSLLPTLSDPPSARPNHANDSLNSPFLLLPLCFCDCSPCSSLTFYPSFLHTRTERINIYTYTLEVRILPRLLSFTSKKITSKRKQT